MCAHVSHKPNMDLLNQNIDSIDFEISQEPDTLPLEQYFQNMEISANNTVTNDIKDVDSLNGSMDDTVSVTDGSVKRKRPVLHCSTPKKKKIGQSAEHSQTSNTTSDAVCRCDLFETSDDSDCDFVCTPPHPFNIDDEN